jgi:hypothetical protein
MKNKNDKIDTKQFFIFFICLYEYLQKNNAIIVTIYMAHNMKKNVL